MPPDPFGSLIFLPPLSASHRDHHLLPCRSNLPFLPRNNLLRPPDTFPRPATSFPEKDEKKKVKSNENLFREELEKYIIAKEAVLSPSTIRGYRNIQKMLSEKYSTFCSMKLSRISQDDVQAVISDLSKTKSPKTVRNYHGLISSVIGPNLVLNTTMPQKVQPDLYVPSDGEIQALVNAVRDTELEIPVLLGAFCMMRRREICGLSMDDIRGNTIHVHHSLVLGTDKKWHLKAPKTETSDRYIEAPGFVTDRIRELGYITNLNPHSITIMFQRVLERNNIIHFRFHDLRHPYVKPTTKKFTTFFEDFWATA